MTDVSPNVLKSLSNRSPQKANSLQQILGFADQEAESSNYVGTYFPRIYFFVMKINLLNLFLGKTTIFVKLVTTAIVHSCVICVQSPISVNDKVSE